MFGAIAGDMIGSIYENSDFKSKEFQWLNPECYFTDDTVLTVALANAILNDRDFGQMMKLYYKKYPAAGYGGSFHVWASKANSKPYNSWGNGSAMRTSSVGYAFNTVEEVLLKAKYYASFTHNHIEGIKGAQAVSGSIFLARTGNSKEEIKRFVSNTFGYNLNQTLDEIRPDYEFNESCQGTVPQAIIAFLESTDFEDVIRNAISLGGDSDTLACIAGSIAEAYYGQLPQSVYQFVIDKLDEELKEITLAFYQEYIL